MASAFVRSGLLPCAPFKPGIAITVRTMELFRRLRLRAPRLSVQAFSMALGDLDMQAARPHLAEQLSVCYDVFISLVDGLNARVNTALGRDSPNWRLANACPPCLYAVENEPMQEISQLLTWDGNNSLSRVKTYRAAAIVEALASDDGDNDVPEGGQHQAPPKATKADKTTTKPVVEEIKRLDTRDGRNSYWVYPERVEKFKKDKFENKWVCAILTCIDLY